MVAETVCTSWEWQGRKMLYPFANAGEILVGKKQLSTSELGWGPGSDSYILHHPTMLELRAFCQLEAAPLEKPEVHVELPALRLRSPA